MPTRLKPVDVAVVGLGAAGGVAVLPLARAGLKVAGIEAGTWMDPHKDFHADEIHNNIRRLVTSTFKAQRECPTLRADASQLARPAAAHPMMNAIGGTSVHYWAQSWRLKPWDFKTRSEAVKRGGASSLPQGSTLEDWPIAYDDLEPYYDLVEYEVGVSGKAGNIQGRIDPAGNVFEAPRRREYPMPPLRGAGFTDRMAGAARQLGWHPFAPPAAINSQPYRGRAGCAYHGYCATGGCHISAKNSTAVTTIPAAVKTGNLTIVDRAQVTRIAAEMNGRVAGVQYLRNGREFFQPAKVVLLASYTYENSRLLLLSKSKAFPQGLANNRGQVGKHYFGHWNDAVGALFPFDVNIWYGLPAQGITVDDWADDHFDHAGLGFIGGTSLHVRTERHPIEASDMVTFGRAPLWGARWKAFVHENAARYANTYLQTSSFPYESSYLDLDPQVADPLGDPVCRITTGGVKQNEQRAAQHAQAKMEEWFRAAGAIEVLKPPLNGPGISTHAYGGTRMGDNPETNVVDAWGFSHEAPNLGILGASVMGTSGARNPTLTVQALAWRTAERLVKSWKSIAVGLLAFACMPHPALFGQQPAAAPASQTAPAAQTKTGQRLAADPGPFLELPAAGRGQGRGPRPVAGPAPHLADGRPDFGGDGAWYPGFSGNIAEPQWKGVHSADKHVDVPFLPWALDTFNERVESLSKDDPEARCLPVGIPRYMFDPYPFQIEQTRNQVVFLFEGDNYLWRVIPIGPNLTHAKNPKPTWLGDSIGHYEGDTLVVDVTGFNGKAWMDQAGHPQSDKQHLMERYTRTDSLTLKYEVTIDDPGAYSKSWTTSNTVSWRPRMQLGESICQENEKDSRHMIGNPGPK